MFIQAGPKAWGVGRALGLGACPTGGGRGHLRAAAECQHARGNHRPKRTGPVYRIMKEATGCGPSTRSWTSMVASKISSSRSAMPSTSLSTGAVIERRCARRDPRCPAAAGIAATGVEPLLGAASWAGSSRQYHAWPGPDSGPCREYQRQGSCGLPADQSRSGPHRPRPQGRVSPARRPRHLLAATAPSQGCGLAVSVPWAKACTAHHSLQRRRTRGLPPARPRGSRQRSRKRT